MVTGWIFVGGNWYYLDSSGAMVTGLIEIDGYKYFMTESGAMYTGYKFIGVLGMLIGPIILIILKSIFGRLIDKGILK